MQTQAPPPAQVALAKPPVVSVPAAVVSSPGVTTLPMNVAGISVAIGQPQKAAGACRVQPLPQPWNRADKPFLGEAAPLLDARPGCGGVFQRKHFRRLSCISPPPF